MVAGPLIAAVLLGGRPGLPRPLCLWRPGHRPLSGAGARLFEGVTPERRARRRTRRWPAIASCLLIAASWRSAVPSLLPLYGFGQIYITLPVLLRDSVGVSLAQWGLLAALYAGCGVLLQFPVMRRTKRFDKLALLSVASACLGVGMAGAAFAPKGLATAAVRPARSAPARCCSCRSPRRSSRRWPRRSCGVATWGPGRWSGWRARPWRRSSAGWPWITWAATPISSMLAVCLLGALLFALLRRSGARRRALEIATETGARQHGA